MQNDKFSEYLKNFEQSVAENKPFQNKLAAFDIIMNYANSYIISHNDLNILVNHFRNHIGQIWIQENKRDLLEGYCEKLKKILEKSKASSVFMNFAKLRLEIFFKLPINLSLSIEEYDFAEKIVNSALEVATKSDDKSDLLAFILPAIHLRLCSSQHADYNGRLRHLSEAMQLAREGLALAELQQNDKQKSYFSDLTSICFAYFLLIHTENIVPVNDRKFSLTDYIYRSQTNPTEKDKYLMRLCLAGDQIIHHAILQYQEHFPRDDFIKLSLQNVNRLYDHVINIVGNDNEMFNINAASGYALDRKNKLNSILEHQNWHSLLQIPLKIDNCYITWQNYLMQRKEHLLALSALEKTPVGNCGILIEKYNQDSSQLIHKMFQECLNALMNRFRLNSTRLKRNECEYALLSLGSAARLEACPYSDLEMAVLVETEWLSANNRVCLEAVLRLFELTILTLGETETRQVIPKKLNITYSSLSKGLRLDEGGNIPISITGKCKQTLLNSPEVLVDEFTRISTSEGDDHVLGNIIQGANFLGASENGRSLYTRFRNKLITTHHTGSRGKHFSVLLLDSHRLRDKAPTPFLMTSEKLHIKDDLIYNLSLLFNIKSLEEGYDETTNIGRINKLQEANLINPVLADATKLYLTFCLRLRYLAHIYYGYECETLYLKAIVNRNEKCFVITERDLRILEGFRFGLLPVLYNSFIDRSKLLSPPTDEIIPAIELIAEDYVQHELDDQAYYVYKLIFNLLSNERSRQKTIPDRLISLIDFIQQNQLIKGCLEKLLKDNNEYRRMNAALSLAELAETSDTLKEQLISILVKSFRACMSDSIDRSRGQIYQSLMKFSSISVNFRQKVIAALMKGLRNMDDSISYNSLQMLLRIANMSTEGREQVIEASLSNLNHQEDIIATGSMQVLSELDKEKLSKNQPIIARLMRNLTGEHDYHQKAKCAQIMVRLLMSCGDDLAEKILTALLGGVYDKFFRWSMHGEMMRTKSLHALVQFSAKSDKLGGQVVNALLVYLRSTSQDRHEHACIALLEALGYDDTTVSETFAKLLIRSSKLEERQRLVNMAMNRIKFSFSPYDRAMLLRALVQLCMFTDGAIATEELMNGLIYYGSEVAQLCEKTLIQLWGKSPPVDEHVIFQLVRNFSYSHEHSKVFVQVYERLVEKFPEIKDKVINRLEALLGYRNDNVRAAEKLVQLFAVSFQSVERVISILLESSHNDAKIEVIIQLLQSSIAPDIKQKAIDVLMTNLEDKNRILSLYSATILIKLQTIHIIDKVEQLINALMKERTWHNYNSEAGKAIIEFEDALIQLSEQFPEVKARIIATIPIRLNENNNYFSAFFARVLVRLSAVTANNTAQLTIILLESSKEYYGAERYASAQALVQLGMISTNEEYARVVSLFMAALDKDNLTAQAGIIQQLVKLSNISGEIAAQISQQVVVAMLASARRYAGASVPLVLLEMLMQISTISVSPELLEPLIKLLVWELRNATKHCTKILLRLANGSGDLLKQIIIGLVNSNNNHSIPVLVDFAAKYPECKKQIVLALEAGLGLKKYDICSFSALALFKLSAINVTLMDKVIVDLLSHRLYEEEIKQALLELCEQSAEIRRKVIEIGISITQNNKHETSIPEFLASLLSPELQLTQVRSWLKKFPPNLSPPTNKFTLFKAPMHSPRTLSAIQESELTGSTKSLVIPNSVAFFASAQTSNVSSAPNISLSNSPARIASDNGFEMISVPGDGNCFFSSIAALLNTHGKVVTHLEVRKQAVEYLRTHQADFLHVFISGEESFENYLQRMSRDGIWAEGIVIDATALCFNIRLDIIDFRDDGILHFAHLNENPKTQNLPLFTLWRTGEDQKMQHYTALQKNPSPKEKLMINLL